MCLKSTSSTKGCQLFKPRSNVNRTVDVLLPASIRSSSSISESINSSSEIGCSAFTCTGVDSILLCFAVSDCVPGGCSGKEVGNKDAGKHGFSSADRIVPADSIQPWHIATAG